MREVSSATMVRILNKSKILAPEMGTRGRPDATPALTSTYHISSALCAGRGHSSIALLRECVSATHGTLVAIFHSRL